MTGWNGFLFLLFGRGGISLLVQIGVLIAAVLLSFALLPWWLPLVWWVAIFGAVFAQSRRNNPAKDRPE